MLGTINNILNRLRLSRRYNKVKKLYLNVIKKKDICLDLRKEFVMPSNLFMQIICLKKWVLNITV